MEAEAGGSLDGLWQAGLMKLQAIEKSYLNQKGRYEMTKHKNGLCWWTMTMNHWGGREHAQSCSYRRTRGCRGGSVVRSMPSPCRGPISDGSQLPVTLFQGHLMPLASVGTCTDVHTQRDTNTHTIPKKKTKTHYDCPLSKWKKWKSKSLKIKESKADCTEVLSSVLLNGKGWPWISFSSASTS